MTRNRSSFVDRRFGRRRFVQSASALAGSGAAFALVGCGGDDDDDGNGNGGDPTQPPQPPAGSTPTQAPPAPTAVPGSAAPYAPEGAVPGGVLTFLTASEPPYMDPHRASSVHMTMATQVYSRLIHKSPDGQEIVNETAEGWEQPDDLTYTFKLRPDLTFHSGDPLTAEEVKFSLERFGQIGATNPDPNMAWAWMMVDVDSVEVVDPLTVQIKTSVPSAPLISYLGVQYNGIVNPNFIDSGANMDTEMDGSGPFMLREWRRSQELSFERNPNYFWPGLPYLDGFRTIISPDAGTNDAAFVAGQTLGAFPHTFSGRRTQYENYARQIDDLQSASADCTFYSFFEINKGRQPWDDPRVRRAVQLAMDQVEIGGRIHDGDYSLSGPVASGFPHYALPEDEVASMPGFRPNKDDDIAEAIALMEAVGYTPDNPLHGLNITTPLHHWYYSISLAVKDNVQKIGIDLEIREYPDFASFLSARAEGDFDTYGLSRGGPDDVDQYFGESFPSDSPLNFGQWNDARTDELIEAQRRELDPDLRRDIVWELSRYFMTESHPQAFVPTMHGYVWWRAPYHVDPRLITPSYTGFFGQFSWLDPVPGNMQDFSSF